VSTNRPSYTAAQLASRFGLEIQGDAGSVVSGVCTLARAAGDQLAFLANPRYRAQLADSQAGIVVMRRDDAVGVERTVLLADDPYATFARIAALFDVRAEIVPGMHPSAVIDSTATIDAAAQVGPFVSIGARSVVAAGVVIGAGCAIGEDCFVGEGCDLAANVTLVKRVRIRVQYLARTALASPWTRAAG
jgi:UDP-3-O-[3-hydroxymyristoyl] glucosamine N-acyltransferase